MGCDIHFFVEKYSSDNFEGPKDISEERNLKLESVLENGSFEPRWIPADKWEYADKYGEGMRWDQVTEFYGNRNYYLFTVLAGVRGDGPTIDEPRGVPNDASYAYRITVDAWDSDAHSCSYFTLQELLDVDWFLYKKNENWLDDFMETIENMKLVDPDPSKVRCCFFFDN